MKRALHTSERSDSFDPSRTTSAQEESFYHLSGGSVGDNVCQGTACFVARHLMPSGSSRTEPQHPRLYCLGQCYAAPASPGQPRTRPRVEVHAPRGFVLDRVARGGARDLDTYIRMDGYAGLTSALRSAPDKLVSELEISELRGRGGAAFPTGQKWRAVHGEPGNSKVVVANADEGDPGAYLDRFLMEDDPFALIEGMTLAAYAVGARRGWIYLRGEYPEAAIRIRDALARARGAGWLGERILGHDFSFDIELALGRGSYICGEETALLNAIEGRRPEPRVRPPYPTAQGLWGRPTLVNNVETLVNAPWIARHGGAAFRELGISGSRGTKAVSLNSLFNRPGLYEVEFGLPLRQIVEGIGGGMRDGARLKGLIIGGPLAGLIPPELLDTRFGFEALRAIGASVGHGGVVAFDEHTSIASLMRHVMSFGAYESCGKCTPCRLGSGRLEQLFAGLAGKRPTPRAVRAENDRIVAVLKETSLCGLGTGLAEFAESAWRYYGKELESCPE